MTVAYDLVVSRHRLPFRTLLATAATASLLAACTPETTGSAPVATAPAAASTTGQPVAHGSASAAAPAAEVTTSSAHSSAAAGSSSAAAAKQPSPSASTGAAGSPRAKVASAAGLTGLGALYAVSGITDGDTIKVMVGGTWETIRIIGLDTPETKDPRKPVQCFGKEASSHLQGLVQSKPVHLQADPSQADRDRYGRLLRRVVLPDGTDVALAMIRGGYGHEYTYDIPYRGQAAYQAAETEARNARRGLWASASCAAGAAVAGGEKAAGAGSAPAPRQSPSPAPQKQATPPQAAQPAGSCKIKGNISSSGEKIFHMPGQMAYDRTKITVSKGERWFCSASEAQAAGWRAAKR